MAKRARVDQIMVERGLAETPARAHALLLAGRVFVSGQRVDKPGALVALDAAVELRGDACPFVSRGGLKLVGVLGPLAIDPTGRVCADIGASTGGFTDVLLQHGAAKVYAVDVGKGLLHDRIRRDPRVVVSEGINARFPLAEAVREPVSLVVMDVSFISLTAILPSVMNVLAPGGDASVVAMVKPQFELPPREVGRGGVVRDDALRLRAVERVIDAARALGLHASGRCDSPVHGPAGNREVFVKWTRARA